ncbi:MAG: extracellular solute-binding protein [Lachnospiraceae bacterium]|nr:extracellular solute-binding protein [Lachnospiraceae bacterium]
MSGNGVIRLWYTDEELKNYIDSAALEYLEREGVHVEPVLVSGVEFVEQIGKASAGTDNAPDIYITGSDVLGKASMAGLTSVISDPYKIMDHEKFTEASFNAVTYKGQMIAYPFYYETAFLIYNRDYLEEIAVNDIKRGMLEANSGEEGEDSENDLAELSDENISKEAVRSRTEELIPDSIVDILSLAAVSDAPGEMENFFAWDVSDVFYNYFFAGAYMDAGGPCGDDPTCIDVYNEESIRCMCIYQSLNEFFSVDSKESDYERVLNDFLEGKTLFAVVTTDAVLRLEEAKEAGTFVYEYGVAPLPGIDDDHSAAGLSTTECVVVNGYSDNKEAANRFAEYLAYYEADTLYDRTGKMPCAAKGDPSDIILGTGTEGADHKSVNATIREMYAVSEELPKVPEFADFWLRLELAYTLVWDGEDPNEILKSLSECLRSEATGGEVTETKIETPEITDLADMLPSD